MRSSPIPPAVKRLLVLPILMALLAAVVGPMSAEAGTRVFLPIVQAGPRFPAYGWHEFWGSTNADFGTDVAVDAAGRIYLAGYSWGDWRGPNGEAPVAPHPQPGLMRATTVVALDSQGNYRWHTFVGSGQPRLTLGADGSIYLATRAAATWNGPAGQPPLHAFSGGDSDLAVTHLDANGHYLWHTFYGGMGRDEALSVAADADGSIVLGGYSSAAWDGPTGQSPVHPFSGGGAGYFGTNGLLLTLGADGAYRWHGFYGSDNTIYGVAVTTGFEIYATGGGAQWNTANGGAPLHAVGAGDKSTASEIMVVKVAEDGAYRWHTFWGGPGTESGSDVKVDAAGNLYVAFSGNAWSGENGAPPLYSTFAAMQYGVLKLMSDGQYAWHTFYGNAWTGRAPSLTVSPRGSVYLMWAADQLFVAPDNAAPLQPYGAKKLPIAIVALNPSGDYRWHTFYGSEDGATDFDNLPRGVFANGTLYVAGTGRNWLGDGGAAPRHGFAGTIDMELVALKNIE